MTYNLRSQKKSVNVPIKSVAPSRMVLRSERLAALALLSLKSTPEKPTTVKHCYNLRPRV